MLAAEAAGGGTIEFEPAEIFAGQRILADRLTVSSNICLIGPDVEPLLTIESVRDNGRAISFGGVNGETVVVERLAFLNSDDNPSNTPFGGSASMIVRECVFLGRKGGFSWGPGVSGAGLLVENCRFENMSSTESAINLNNSSVQDPGQVTIRDCIFKNIVDVSRGTVNVDTRGRVRVERCLFERCDVQSAGGVYISSIGVGGLVEIDACSFINNNVSNRGGAILRETTGLNFVGDLFISNCTFDGNSAQGRGGAMSIYQATVVNCTVTGNSSGIESGGGIHNPTPERPVTVHNSIVVGNTFQGNANDLAGVFDAGSTGNIIGTVPAGFPAAGNRRNVSLSNVGLDSLVDFGDGRPVRPLTEGSMALDTAVVAAAIDSEGAALPYDGRGEPYLRQRRGGIDVGAHELLDVFIVSNVEPAGDGSLAKALADAEAAQGAHVRFDPGFDFSGKTAVANAELNHPIELSGPEVNPPLTIGGSSVLSFKAGSGRLGDAVRISNVRIAGADLALRSELSLVLSDCVFDGNTDGLIFDPQRFGQSLVIDGCEFVNHRDGAPVHVISEPGFAAQISVIDSQFRDNQAAPHAGGLTLENVGKSSVIRSVFVGNSGSKGGGLWVDLARGNFAMNDSSFINNFADEAGSFYRPSSDDGGKCSIWNSTFSGNRDGAGGDLVLYNADLVHCTIALGTGDPTNVAVEASAAGRPVTLSNCLLVGDQLPEVSGDVKLDNRGNVIALAADAELVALEEIGGGRQVHPIGPGGAAVDAGQLGLAVDDRGAPLAFDQRGSGFPRLLGDNVDAGAFEAPGAVAGLSILEFFADPREVIAGQKSLLRWAVAGADQVRLEPEIGVVNVNEMEVTPPMVSWETVLPRGSVWRYEDERVDLYSLAVPFYDPAFNDSGWSSGPARLGYGGDGERTLINGGPSGSRRIASYYRNTFEISHLQDVAGAVIEVARDDGVVIFINGEEVVRDNMPQGTIRFTTTALNGIGGSDESRFFRFPIDPSVFKEGQNVIAVGLHQINSSSSDAGLDLELSVFLSGAAVYRLTASENGGESVTESLRIPVEGVRFAPGTFLEITETNGTPTPGDLDGDGDMDFIYGANARDLYIRVENVDGDLFNRGRLIPETDDLEIHAVHDLTGDGAAELIFRDEDGLGYYVNDGSAGFPERVILKNTIRETGTILMGDAEGDGDEDIIVLVREEGVIGFYPYNGPGDIGEFTVLANTRNELPLNAQELVKGDYNGDGQMDLMVRAELGRLYWLRNTGSGNYVFSRADRDQQPNPGGGLALDIDADGRDEFLVSSVPVNYNRVGLYDFEGGVWNYTQVFDEFFSTSAGDFNGDGAEELIRSTENGLILDESRPGGEKLDSGYLALLNRGRGPNAEFSYGTYGLAVDLDGDGDNDLVTVGSVLGDYGLVYTENLTITDSVEVSLTPLLSAELVEDSVEPKMIEVKRSGDTREALNVTLAFTGAAVLGEDFSVDTVVSIPAGEESAVVLLQTEPDNLDEDDEAIEISIVPSESYLIVEDSGMVALTIVDDDFTPIAVADDFETIEDQTMTISAVTGVLANDTDEDDQDGPFGDLTVAVVADAEHGELQLEADGSFTYVPDRDFFGPDSFSYTTSDGTNVSEPAVVSIVVNELVDLRMTAVESRDPVIAGHAGFGSVEHVLTLRNIGPSQATGVVVSVTSQVPDGVATTVTGGEIVDGRWMVGSLGEGEVTSITLGYLASATAPGGTDVLNTGASVSELDQPRVNPADDEDAVATSLVSPADVDAEEIDVEPVLNRRTGLYEKRLRLTNNNTLDLNGLRLVLSGLPENVTLRNGNDGDVTHAQRIAVGGSVTLTIEFLSADRSSEFSPEYVVELLAAGEGEAQLFPGERFEIDRMIVLADGSVLLEWPALAGARYGVEYSDDMLTWKAAGPSIVAGGNRVQWIDNGGPKTSPHPSSGGTRYYRIIQVPEE